MAAPSSRPGPEPIREGMPTEIMVMIITAAEPHTYLQYGDGCESISHTSSRAILEGADIFDLRLASRHIEYTSLNRFGTRFFTVRKLMFSRRSVQCPQEISTSQKLSGYVKGLVIILLRINPHLDKNMERKWADELDMSEQLDYWSGIEVDEMEGEKEREVKRQESSSRKRGRSRLKYTSQSGARSFRIRQPSTHNV